MALEFEFPDTGEGVTEGQFLEWLVEEGEEVEEDQTVAEVETDKAVVDVPAPASGVARELKVEPGDNVQVGEVIMILDDEASGTENEGSKDTEEAEKEEESEQHEEEKNDETDEEPEDREEVEIESSAETEVEPSPDDVLALPKVRKKARDKNIDLTKVEGSGPEGRILEEDLGSGKVKQEPDTTDESDTEDTVEENEIPSNAGDVKATPATRKLARQEEVDLGKIEGSGRGGKITREDVLEAAESGEPETERETGTVEEKKAASKDTERVKMSGARKAIAERMEESRFTAPHVTHVEKADVTELVELREEKKDDLDVHLTYLPFIMKSAMLSLKKYPELNAELDEEKDEIVQKKHYDFNIAVDTDRGLMVPVVEDIDEKSILELAGDIGEAAEKAQEGNISMQEMEGGTFSITNLGVIGGEEFTPIINYPQVAILGIGKISETAEVVDGEVVPRHTVKLSLSYDHRVVDGATAARFMNHLVENLEDPEKMLMEL